MGKSSWAKKIRVQAEGIMRKLLRVITCGSPTVPQHTEGKGLPGSAKRDQGPKQYQ